MILEHAITERRDFERARLTLSRLQVSGGDALKQALATVTETAAATLNVERVGIWLYVQNRKAIRCYDLYQVNHQHHSEGAILYAADFPEYFQALEKQRAIVAMEAVSDPLTRRLKEAYLDPLGITAMLDAPIFRGGEVMGVVCHEHTGGTRRWTREECDFAGTVADSIAMKFESAARQDAEHSKKTLEVHLADLHKMDAVGRIASTVAHDFKNILTVVMAGAQLINKKAGHMPEVKMIVEQILEASDHANGLLTELMTFGRNQQQKTQVLDAAQAVEAMVPMLQTTLGESHPVQFERGDGPRLVFIDRNQLERVVLNLVLNARDALPNGGPIKITVNEAKVCDDAEAGVYTSVEVADGGTGMDAATRSRIFEPFFTTKSKAKAKGAGLGLSIVHRIIDRAGGFLHVASEPSKGTTVRLYLPRVSSK